VQQFQDITQNNPKTTADIEGVYELGICVPHNWKFSTSQHNKI
jgi:hypothetical protein